MGKITNKEYYCPVCGWVGSFSTNHVEEIYIPCKGCNNNILYCKKGNLGEAEGDCRIIFYKFDLSNLTERNEYNTLQKYLGSKYEKKFTAKEHYKTYRAIIKYNRSIILLYKMTQFKDQFVSSIGRVHVWKEYILDNKSIKCGYYLDEFRAYNLDKGARVIRKKIYKTEYGNPYVKLYDNTLLELDERGRIWYVKSMGSCIVVHYNDGELGFDFSVGGRDSRKYKEIKRLMNNGLKEYLIPYKKQRY